MKKFPDLKRATLLLIILWVIEIICVSFFTIISLELGFVSNELSVVLGIITGCGVMWWGWDKTGESFSSIFPLNFIRGNFLMPITITVLGVGIVSSDINNLIRYFYPMPIEMTEALALISKDASFVFIVVTNVIMAPILEESLFRGLILHGFLLNYSKQKSILWSAFLFGIMHLNPWQFPSAFVLGIVFGWWMVKTNSLLPGILGHALNNLIGIIIYRFDILGLSLNLMEPVMFQPWWVDLLGLLLAVSGLLLFERAVSIYEADGRPLCSFSLSKKQKGSP